MADRDDRAGLLHLRCLLRAIAECQWPERELDDRLQQQNRSLRIDSHCSIDHESPFVVGHQDPIRLMPFDRAHQVIVALLVRGKIKRLNLNATKRVGINARQVRCHCDATGFHLHQELRLVARTIGGSRQGTRDGEALMSLACQRLQQKAVGLRGTAQRRQVNLVLQ